MEKGKFKKIIKTIEILTNKNYKMGNNMMSPPNRGFTQAGVYYRRQFCADLDVYQRPNLQAILI